MKKRTTVLVLTIALTLVLGGFQTVFAGIGPATEATMTDIAANRTSAKTDFSNEVNTEKFAIQFADEAKSGGYELINAEELSKIYQDVVVIDTMPNGWVAKRKIPGAINLTVGGQDGSRGPKFEMLPEEATAIDEAVKAAVGTKKVTKWYNKKTKKWTTKKPAKKYRGESKKVNVVNKDKEIVVYCGFTGCARSHVGAMYLVQQGYTNVKRLPGGICSWVDGGYPIEGTDIAD